MGGFFKFFLEGGFAHPLFQDGGQLPDVSLENRDSPLDSLPVLLCRNRADAGGAAVFHNPLQTAFACLFIRVRVAAGTQPEVCEQKFQCHSESAAIWKRPEILCPVIFPQPGEFEGRERLAPVDLQQQIAFVVPHEDVVVGGVIFDQTGFEDQSFALGSDHFVAPVLDRVDQRPQFCIGTHEPGGLKIGAHSAAQIRGLAHIDDFPGPVPIDIDPRLPGNLGWMKFAFPHILPLR